MENLNQTIETAKKVMKSNNMSFVTIWETKTKNQTSYGFNFDNKKVGFIVKEIGVKRTVLSVINEN